MDQDLVSLLLGLAMVVGLLGTLVPVLPGLALMWGAALLTGFTREWDSIAIVFFALITFAAAVGAWLAIRIPRRQTADAGVGVATQLLALSLAVIGFFVIPVFGAAVGFVSGIAIGMLWKTRRMGSAWSSTKAAIVSMFYVASGQFVTGLVILGIWLVWVVVL